MRRLFRVYAALLRLAERPRHFRSEFGDEMQRVRALLYGNSALVGRRMADGWSGS